MSDEIEINFVSDLGENTTVWATCRTCPRHAIIPAAELDPWQILSEIKKHLVCKVCGGRNCSMSLSYQEGDVSKSRLYAGYKSNEV